MVLDLCERWNSESIRVAIVNLGRGPDELRYQFGSLGVPILDILVGTRGYARYLRLAFGMWHICREMSPRAVLCMPMGLHTFVAIGARLAGVRRIVAHVGNPPMSETGPRSSLRKYRLLARLGQPFMHRLICCSQYVQEAATRNLRIPRASTEVVHNGVQGKVFREARDKRATKLERMEHVIGMVGTLEGHKDQATLIRAAAILRRECICVQVRLVGEGQRRTELETLIADLDAPVTLLGSVSDVPKEIAELDLFVFSTTDEEGLGIALLEAMAAGIPVVASNVPACREVLFNNDCELGVLVPAGDPQALAAGIRQVLDDPESAVDRTDAARKRAFQDFSAGKMARRYAEILGIESTARNVA